MLRALFLFQLVVLATSVNAKEPESTIDHMRGIYEALSAVLPYSFDRFAFSSPERQEFIASRLALLKERAQFLPGHLRLLGPDYEYRAKALSTDIAEVHDLYARKSFHQARFVLHHVSQHCVNCHSKRPSADGSVKPGELFSRVDTSRMTRLDKAHFEVMMRRYSDALDTYSNAFVQNPELLDLDYFAEYARLCIAVTHNLDRLDDVLSKALTPTRTRDKLARSLKQWRQDIARIRRDKLHEDVSFASAEKLIDYGLRAEQTREVQSGVIFFVTAASVLGQLKDRGKLGPDEESRAYYRLGQVESFVPESVWISEPEFLFELAIRKAPQSEWAKRAFIALKDQITLDYTGSGGTHVPKDLKAKLTELQSLL